MKKKHMLINKRDDAYLETLGKIFQVPLHIYNFNIKSVKNEWKKVQTFVYLYHKFYLFFTKLI